VREKNGRFAKGNQQPKGKESHHWKGENIGYGAIHERIKTKFGKASGCENLSCEKKSNSFDWANLSGEYKFERSDWKMLCRKYHLQIDLKKNFCKKGHRLEGNNLCIDPKGHRRCRKCNAIGQKKYRDKKRGVEN